jgi:hypothetical protein
LKTEAALLAGFFAVSSDTNSTIDFEDSLGEKCQCLPEAF